MVGGSAILTALVPVMYTYDGWSNLSFIGGEVKDPGRNLPRALIVGTAAIVVIYLLVNVAYLHVLPVPAIAAAERVAAAAAAADPDVWRGRSRHHRRNRDGVMLRIGQRIDDDRAPGLLRHERPGAALSGCGAGLPAVPDAFGGDLAGGGAGGDLRAAEFLCPAGRSFRAGNLAVLCAWRSAGVFILRRKRPDLPRPYRTFGYPVTPALFLLASVGMMVNAIVTNPRDNGVTFGIILAGVPVYWGWRWWEGRKNG